jgi:hypothetical protein
MVEITGIPLEFNQYRSSTAPLSVSTTVLILLSIFTFSIGQLACHISGPPNQFVSPEVLFQRLWFAMKLKNRCQCYQLSKFSNSDSVKQKNIFCKIRN